MVNDSRQSSWLSLALLPLCLIGGTTAPAGELTWIGATNTFNAPGNWSGNTLPVEGDSLVFGAPGPGGVLLQNNLTGLSLGEITFTSAAGAYVVGNGTTTPNVGNTLSLTGSIVNGSTNTQVINNPLTLSDGFVFRTGTGGGNITLGGDILSSDRIVATGSGMLTLSGSNAGSITVSQGAVVLNSNTAGGQDPIVLGDHSTGASNVAVNFGSGITGNNLALRGGASARQVTDITVNDTGSPGTATLGFTGATSMLYFDAALDRAVTITSNNATRLQRSWMGQITGAGAGSGNDSIIIDAGSGNWISIFAKDTGSASVANTFSGNIRVKSGNLEIGGLTYLGNTAANENLTIPATASVTVDAGAALQFVWGDQTFDALNGGGLIVNNTTDNQGAKNLTIGASGGSGNFSGTITSLFNITKTGAGTQIFSGNNTYSGVTTIDGGTLQLGNGGAAGSITGNVVNHGTLAFNRSDDTTFAGTVSGSGGVTIHGGVVRFTGAHTYTGPTQINGTLVLPSTEALAPGISALSPDTVVTMNSTGMLDLSGRAQTIAGLTGSGLVYNFGETSGHLTVNVAADQTDTFSGTLGGHSPNLAFTKAGPGTQILSGSSHVGGGITVTDGHLQVGNGVHAVSVRVGDGADGIGGTYPEMGTPGGVGKSIEVTGGTLRISAHATLNGGNGGAGGSSGPDPTSLENFALVGGRGGQGGAAVHLSLGGSMVNDGTIIGGRGGQGGTGGGVGDGGTGGIGVYFSAGGSLTNTGTITGGAGGAGGSYNDWYNGRPGMGVVYSGGAGTLVHRSGGVINGGVSFEAYANAVTLETGSRINGALDIANLASATLTLTGSGIQAYSDAVTGATTFAGSLIKTGPGTWTLDQTFSYEGSTTVNAGTLVIDGSIASSSIVTINDGGTLGGHGMVGDVEVRAGGILSPGNSPGLLTIAGGLSLNTGATLVMEFGSASLYDQLNVEGLFTAGGTLNLLLIDGFTPFAGNSFTIFSGSTPGFEAGQFTITSNLAGGLSWDTSQLSSSGIVTVVPEPTTISFLALGVGGVALARRRRQLTEI